MIELEVFTPRIGKWYLPRRFLHAHRSPKYQCDGRCNSLSCPPGQLAPGGGGGGGYLAARPGQLALPPQKTQFKMIFIFFYNKFISHNYQNNNNVCFHYFSLYGRRLGLRYCSLSIFLPNSEVLADTVQKDILSLLIEFPIEQVIRESPVFDITYLSSNRKGWGVRYPGLGSLPPGAEDTLV